MKRNILLFGGAFDPIHWGHLQAMKKALEYTKLFHEGWFLPCFKSAWNDKTLSSGEDRSNMIEIAIDSFTQIPGLRNCTYEIENCLTGGTIEIVQSILEDLGRMFNFHFLISLEHANQMHLWKNGPRLTKDLSFVVVHRAGVVQDRKIDWYLGSPHIYIDEPLSSALVSSTTVRRQVARDGYSKWVPSEVMKYIEEKGLYRAP